MTAHEMTERPGRSGDGRAGSKALSPEEQAVVARFAGGFGWPTVLLAVALLVVEVGVVALWAAGVIPMVVGFLVNSWVAYAWYTVHHDATHKAISGRNPKLAWLELACGNVAGFALQLDFGGYSTTHLKHHAHTNTLADPDLAVKGPLWQVPIKWFVLMVLLTIGALPGCGQLVGNVLEKLAPDGAPTVTDREVAARGRIRRQNQVGLVLLLATIPFGAFWPAFVLLWLPSRIGILMLMILFQWLPHFPFDRTDRFGATRINRFPGSTWLLLQQDRHLIHHLYPQVPWYRYRAVFRALRPVLEEKDAVIEGTGTTPHVPIRLR